MIKKTKEENGITLIILVVTIILLLILAGISFSYLTSGDGILQKTKNGVGLKEIAEIEEAANSIYAKLLRKKDSADISMFEIMTELNKEKNNTIVSGWTEGNELTELNIDNDTIYIEENDTKTITVSYTNGKLQYFAVVNGKNYLIDETNNGIKISKEPANIKSILNVSSSNNDYVEIDSVIKDNNNKIIITLRGKEKTTSAITISVNGEEMCVANVINKVDLTLAASTNIYTFPRSGQLKIVGNPSNGELSVKSSDPNVAAVDISGNWVTIEPQIISDTNIDQKEVTITITSKANGKYKEKTATHKATICKGTMKLEVTIPEEITFNGSEQDAVSNIKCYDELSGEELSDVDLKYAIHGKKFSNDIPKVKNANEYTIDIQASKAGYITKNITKTVTVNKSTMVLALSSYEGTYTYPTSGTFEVSDIRPNGVLNVTSENENVAIASIKEGDGNVIKVIPQSVGETTININVPGDDNYKSQSAIYKVTVKKDIGDFVISLNEKSYIYNGEAKTPTVTVIDKEKDEEKQLTQGTDYTVSYSNNINVGEATVTITGSGYYTGSKTDNFNINHGPNTLVADANTTFSTAYGRIDVIWLDTSNNVISTPNSPVLISNGESMTPVVFDEPNSTWVDTSSSMSSWYDYSSNKWANAMTANSSYFVWIPRYAYRITYYDSAANLTGYYDGYGMWKDDGGLRYSLDSGIETVDYNGYKYIVHPAFCDGKNNSFENGEWDDNLTGFWFAKFEMGGSATNLNSTYGEASLTSQAIGTQYTTARKATYGYTGVADTDGNTSYMHSHMCKNSEWGAVAYLTQSKYGRNGTEITINNNSSFLRGGGTGTAYITNVAQSTTGNVYGIYDMSGNAWDRVAIFNNINSNGYLSTYGWTTATGLTVNSSSTKYATKYTNTTSSYSGNAVIYKYGKIGDATKEVNTGGANNEASTTECKNWFSDYSAFVKSSHQFFSRGGHYSQDLFAGVFSLHYGSGVSDSGSSFRAVLCP